MLVERSVTQLNRERRLLSRALSELEEHLVTLKSNADEPERSGLPLTKMFISNCERKIEVYKSYIEQINNEIHTYWKENVREQFQDDHDFEEYMRIINPLGKD